MTLLALYNSEIAAGNIQRDPAQEHAIQVLQGISDGLVNPKPQPPTKGFRFFSKPEPRSEVSVKGAYLWGGVGRGKTWLMDFFFKNVPIAEKNRYHYHHFMLMVHEELRKLGTNQTDPLELVAKKIASNTELLCIDEFHVLDIGDAMILAGLLQGLVHNDVTIVTTSNRPPDDLYKNGLQRARFLPAIDLLKKNLQVIELDNGIDYRMRHVVPIDEVGDNITHSDPELEERFSEEAKGKVFENVEMELNGRRLPVRKMADNIIWLDFKTVCDGPRSTSDYIELAARYGTIILSDIPIMNQDSENAARRFLNFIDELYDCKVQLIISTRYDIKELYQGQLLKFEFARAFSRLNEMQSPTYLAA